MVVDTSALVAVLRNEAAAAAVLKALRHAPSLTMSAAALVEARAVMSSKAGPVGRRLLDSLIREVQIATVPLSAAQADLASQAFTDFGRGSGSPAKLNYGDCFSYALAAETGEELLFVGDDFTHTDLRSAL
ncbi:type II toxin-antitoxin system VapC family toxin [Nesterenkonia muleiensis]|uniref:type II toxin-antitoxin system VapC family toxin n=1 Tax=Nesterenkonia muleiensis TaxID=2282648 RepID=UPI000E73C3C6|nr:type II toxin-antitoxin system VapC family toxin [Nesterenkonia muleiensis]